VFRVDEPAFSGRTIIADILGKGKEFPATADIPEGIRFLAPKAFALYITKFGRTVCPSDLIVF
jgi:hypothetical protein